MEERVVQVYYTDFRKIVSFLVENTFLKNSLLSIKVSYLYGPHLLLAVCKTEDAALEHKIIKEVELFIRENPSKPERIFNTDGGRFFPNNRVGHYTLSWNIGIELSTDGKELNAAHLLFINQSNEDLEQIDEGEGGYFIVALKLCLAYLSFIKETKEVKAIVEKTYRESVLLTEAFTYRQDPLKHDLLESKSNTYNELLETQGEILELTAFLWESLREEAEFDEQWYNDIIAKWSYHSSQMNFSEIPGLHILIDKLGICDDEKGYLLYLFYGIFFEK